MEVGGSDFYNMSMGECALTESSMRVCGVKYGIESFLLSLCIDRNNFLWGVPFRGGQGPHCSSTCR